MGNITPINYQNVTQPTQWVIPEETKRVIAQTKAVKRITKRPFKIKKNKKHIQKYLH